MESRSAVEPSPSYPGAAEMQRCSGSGQSEARKPARVANLTCNHFNNNNNVNVLLKHSDEIIYKPKHLLR